MVHLCCKLCVLTKQFVHIAIVFLSVVLLAGILLFFVRTLDCKMNVVLQFQVFYGLLGELNSHLITPNTNWRHKLRIKFYLSYC